MITRTLFIFFMFSLNLSQALFSQSVLAEIDGSAKIRGAIDIHYDTDTSLVLIGYNAGLELLSSFQQRGLNDPWRNTYVGSGAGKASINGSNNSFFGFEAGVGSAEGSNNSFFGYGAGAVTQEGENSFYGTLSGVQNDEGEGNSFFGYWSGFSNIHGSSNSYFGIGSGSSNVNGSDNTYIGTGSGVNNQNGHGNVAIGTFAGINSSNDSLDHTIAIGLNAIADCHNCAVIGGVDSYAVNLGLGVSNPKSVLHIKQRDIGTQSGFRITLPTVASWNMYLNNGKKLNFALDGNRLGFIDDVTGDYTATSDLRMKTQITNLGPVLDDVLKLEPVLYKYLRNVNEDPKTLGLIAQDIAQYFPEIVKESDDVLGITYSKIGVLAIKAIQEQQAIIMNQHDLISALYEKIENIEKRLK